MLTVGVLGAVQAQRDGAGLDLPAGRSAELLARLALAPDGRARTDALLEDLWSEPTSRNTLQAKVSQLRRALGDRDALLGSPDGYRLVVDEVDAARAATLAAEAAAAREAGDIATALDRARDGLALYRGEILADAGPWAEPHRARLEELRLGLLEDVMAARVDLGGGGELVPELEALVEEHPLREGLWVSLVTALYRGGRQADALAAYRRVRRLLDEELGIEPGPALQALERRVLQQDELLGGSPVRAVATPGNLPTPGPTLVGRDAEVVGVARALTESRLVTLVGPAGVGKTRLALEVARGLAAPGGVWLVRLDAVPAGGSVEQAVAETLHVPSGTGALVARLAGAGTVLVLDNCEHVAPATATLARSLLDAAPSLRVLATSQVAFGLDEERPYAVEPLSREESVELFAQRARAMRPSFALAGPEAAAVEEVCATLDGLPLAIELAASRVRSLSARDIVRRLDDRFALLQDPSSQRPERRRALAGAIAWSYDLLFPDDQRGLWALSCFSGGASYDAVEQVLAALGVPPTVALDTVGRLVDRSLVGVDATDDGGVRYRLLDSVRAFATDRLQEAGQGAVAAQAHARWCAEVAAWCAERVRTAEQAACVALARTERANVDAALAWCAEHDPVLGLGIVARLGWTWVVLGDGPAGAARVRGALTQAGPIDDRREALLLAGWLEASAGDVALAKQDLDGAAALAEDELAVADVARHRAFLAIQQGRPDLVRSHADAGLEVYRRRGSTWSVAGSLLLRAFGHLMVGDTRSSTRDATEALGVLEACGDSWGQVHATAMLGGIAQAEGRFDDAATALERAASESERLGFLGQAALHRAGLARVRHRAGEADAEASYERAMGDALACGDGRLAATARLQLARLQRAAGRVAEARSLLEQNEQWYAASGGGDFASLNRAVLAALTDDVPALEAVVTDPSPEARLVALDALSRLAPSTAEGLRLLAEADALAASLVHLVDDADRVDAAQARARWH